MTRSLAFLSSPKPEDYGSHFSRLRWRRAVVPERVALWDALSSAREAVGGAHSWVVVLDGSALPVRGGVPEPSAGTVSLSETSIPLDPPFVHTLGELERAELRGSGGADRRSAAALSFRSKDFPPSDGETVSSFLVRLAASASALVDPGFRVVVVEDPSSRERPELTRRLPGGSVRILDVGCGAGEGIAAARGRNPGWNVTGIERDPALASRARKLCDRVLEGDLREILSGLAAAGDRFDAFVFADVLEHLDDPISALRKSRELAAAGATLVASVPNVGHLSIVRDLLQGRFDPVPAGLCDAGHVRWFTRSWLSEALEEAGWRVLTIDGEPGAPAPDAEAFLELAAAWPGSDRESLLTYQWVAVCQAG